MQQVTNFGRFYSAFRRLEIHGDRDECKCQLVQQYTNGRTWSLKEVTAEEYKALCEAVENLVSHRDELRTARSITLKLLQELGIDTTDWHRINDFCRQPRIAGMPFGKLNVSEHRELHRKLRAIKSRGWQTTASNAQCMMDGVESGMWN